MIKDKRTIKAKQEGLRARSAYKLEEINKKYKFLQHCHHAIDLGSWPGGWSIIAAQFCPVTAVDLVSMYPVDNVHFIKADIFDDTLLEQLPPCDAVLSDAAPNTAGDSRDQYLSFLLCERALSIARLRLRRNGNFVCKIFQGPDFDDFLEDVRKDFSFVKCMKPVSSKPQSKEMYVVAMGFGLKKK